MPRISRHLSVDVKPNFYRVRFHEPGQFTTCRVPAWASKAAGSVVPGAKTTQCRKGKTWKTQSVMIPRKGRTKRAALKAARKIYKKIERL